LKDNAVESHLHKYSALRLVLRLVSQAAKLEQSDVRLNVFHKTQIMSHNFRIEEMII